ncbi:MAG: MauE/DoxX family redox-associated membrane protein [Chloroflexota bacterium]
MRNPLGAAILRSQVSRDERQRAWRLTQEQRTRRSLSTRYTPAPGLFSTNWRPALGELTIGYLATSARWIVGLVILTAGVAKLRFPRKFAAAINTYGTLPHNLTHVSACLLISVQVLLGSGLLLGVQSRLAGLASSAL